MWYSASVPYKDPDRHREYVRLWMQRRREEYFSDKTCAACGSHEQLELDHVDPGQKVHHAIWSWSKLRREAELEKCQVLCNPCHLKKTISEFRGDGHPNAKITEDQAQEILARLDVGEKQKDVGAAYGLSQQQVSRIKNGKRWRHLRR